MVIQATCQVGINLEKSRYRQSTLGEVMRAFYGGVYNNPTKSMTMLVTDNIPRDSTELMHTVYEECYGVRGHEMVREMGLKSTFPITIEEYFDKAILELSHFAGREKVTKRIKRKTGFAEKKIWKYYKANPDGYLFGDLAAYNAIDVSSSTELKASTYLMYGTATTQGMTDSPTITSLLLTFLDREIGLGREIPLHEIVDDFFEFGGDRSSEEYDILRFRFSKNILPRLDRTGLIDYEIMNTRMGEKIVYVPKHSFLKKITGTDTFEKLEGKYSKSGWLYSYKLHAPKIFSTLLMLKQATNVDISKETNFTEKFVGGITSMLRYAGHIEIARGKPLDKQATVRWRNVGRNYCEKFLYPCLELMGFEEALKKSGKIKYGMFEEKVQPNLEGILEWRKRFVDPIVEDPFEKQRFRKKCITARKRHQNESGHILYYIR